MTDTTSKPKDPLLMMAEMEVALAQDPLNELARKARRNILLWSAVAVLVTQAGLMPVEIAAFGIKFSGLQQQWILYFLGAVLVWSLAEFRVHESSGLVMRDLTHMKLSLEFTALKNAWKEQGTSSLGPNIVAGVEAGLLDGSLKTRAMKQFGARALVEVYGTYAVAATAIGCLAKRLWL